MLFRLDGTSRGEEPALSLSKGPLASWRELPALLRGTDVHEESWQSNVWGRSEGFFGPDVNCQLKLSSGASE